MSIENLPAIGNDTVDNLKSILSSVELLSTNRRVGENGVDNMSVYETSRWYDWDMNKVQEFKDQFDSAHVEKAITGWYLHLPANTGFLDVMDYWVDKPDSGTVVAYSLTDGNNIVINGNTYTCNAGEGIKFSLRYKHEIKTNPAVRSWACLMLLQ
jgi:hypothetical protein